MLSLLSAFLLALLTHSANAQLASCTDIGCPLAPPYSTCSLDSQQLISLGVTNFTTALSPDSLSWTVGYIPRPPMPNNIIAPDSRVFYLGQPPSSNLRENNSVTVCALFFNQIAPKLKFNYSEPAPDPLTSKGTCDDALTAPCVLDWTQQAENVARYSNDANFTCDRLADELRAHPPNSCKVAKKSWGAVAAQTISGSNMPRPMATDDCNTTMYSEYSQTRIFSINSTKDDMFGEITPILTVIRPTNADRSLASEAHLSCLKPVFDGVSSDMGFQGAATGYQAHPAITLFFSSVLVLYWLF